MNGVGYSQPSDAVYANSQTNGGTIPEVIVLGQSVATGSISIPIPTNAISNSVNGLLKPNKMHELTCPLTVLPGSIGMVTTGIPG